MEGVSGRARFDEPASTRDDTSIGQLLRNLRDETSTLLRQEVTLAKTEMSEKASRVGRNVAYLAVGGLVAYAGVLFLLLGLSYLLSWLLELAGVSTEVATWLGPLMVGAVVAVIGYSLVQKAISVLRHESLVPEKTVNTLKEDKQWAQDKIT